MDLVSASDGSATEGAAARRGGGWAVRRDVTATYPFGRPDRGPRSVRTVPKYADPEAKWLSEQLEKAYARKSALSRSGQTTEAIQKEILDLKRKLREGGQLQGNLVQLVMWKTSLSSPTLQI